MFDTLHAEVVGKAGPGQDAGGLELPLALDEAMASHISRVLKNVDGRINGPGGAAELLRINANTLRGRMRKLGIRYGRGKR